MTGETRSIWGVCASGGRPSWGRPSGVLTDGHQGFANQGFQTGHGHSADRSVIDLVSELAKICPDKAIAVTLNRSGYKTGHEKSWNAAQVASLRGYHKVEPFHNRDGSVIQEQAAEELKVSDTG